jgi:hypothetical protein
VGGDVFVDSDAFLMTDFINLKIKPTQSFKYAYKSMMGIHVFIGVRDRNIIFILYF